MLATVSRALLLIGLVAAPLPAEVVRIDVHSRADLVGAQPFGPAGPYEDIAGKIFFAVDPTLPANRIVTDLEKAPRNANGKVEFSPDFFLIKPKRIGAADPRPAIDERYRNKDHYIGLVTNAALELIDQRYLLAEDLASIVRNAARHWDYSSSIATSSTAQR
jgi:hypothetical protein